MSLLMAQAGVIAASGVASSYAPTLSYEFNGADEYIDLGTILAGWTIDDPLTIGFHMKPAAPLLCMFGSTTSANFGIFAPSGSYNLRFRVYDDGGSNIQCRWTGTNPAAGSWYHIAITYSGSRASSGMALYVDGDASTNAKTGTALSGGTPSASYNIGYGTKGGASSYYYPGRMQNFRIARAELSAAEIAEWAAANAPGVDSVQGLNWWMTSTNDTDTVVEDLLGATNGTAVNMTTAVNIVTDAP